MFVKLLVGEITPVQLVAGRVALGASALLPMMVLTRSTPVLTRPLILGGAALALIDTVVPYLLISWSQRQVASSTAALLVSTMPLFTTIIVARTGEERVHVSALAGLASGFLGVAVLMGPDALDLRSGSALEVGAVVVAAACYAAGAVYSRTLKDLADPIGLSAVKLALATLALVPVMVAMDGVEAFGSLGWQGWLGLIAVGFVSTGLGRCIYQWVIVTAGSIRASLVTYIVPAVALLLGWAVLDEPLTASTAVGGGLIISGVAGVMYGPRLGVGRIRSWLSERASVSRRGPQPAQSLATEKVRAD
jgi:drug/metabolite transporter (DMT)-like permease